MMKRFLAALNGPSPVFLFLGFVSVIAQSLLLRELLAVFQGNELAIGVLLSNWLLSVALGSSLAGKSWRGRRIPEKAGLIYTCLGAGAYLPVALILIRSIREALHLLPGEGASLKIMALSSLLIAAPLGICLGAQFTLGIRLAKDYRVSNGYLWESIGYLAGGAIFTFVLLPSFTSSAIVLLLSICCLLLAVLLASGKKRILFGMTAVLLALLPFLSGFLEKQTLSLLYRKYTIKEALNSPYSQLVVAERNGETSFFSNGIPLLSLPNSDVMKSEESAVLPLLFHPSPRRVLLIGSSAKIIPPLLARDIDSLDYIELDPYLLPLIRKHWPPEAESCLNDPRLSFIAEDGRRFLQRQGGSYDVIIIALPYPVNLSLNRYFTAEFFAAAKERLSDNGIVALSMPGSLVYLNSAMSDLSSGMLDTLQGVFSSVKILPGDENMIIASPSPLAPSYELKNRFRRRQSATLLLSTADIDARMDGERTVWLKSELKKYHKKTVVNRDSRPKGMLASLVYWQSVFAPNTTSYYAYVLKYSWLIILLVMVWVVSGTSGFWGTAFTSGSAGMGLQMLGIWGLQACCAGIYHWIGALTAAFMAGSALGAWYIRHRTEEGAGLPEINRRILQLEMFFCLWIIAWLLLLHFSVAWQLFFLFSAGSGLVVGMEFPLITGALSQHRNRPAGIIAGNVYTADLFGAWLAALFGGTILIPAWGFEKTIALILAIKVINYYWWVKSARQPAS